MRFSFNSVYVVIHSDQHGTPVMLRVTFYRTPGAKSAMIPTLEPRPKP